MKGHNYELVNFDRNGFIKSARRLSSDKARLESELSRVAAESDEMSRLAQRRQEELDVVRREQADIRQELIQARCDLEQHFHLGPIFYIFFWGIFWGKFRGKFSPQKCWEKMEFSAEKVLKNSFSKKFRGKKCTKNQPLESIPRLRNLQLQHRRCSRLARFFQSRQKIFWLSKHTRLMVALQIFITLPL
jgi:BMFP domain-containing protein YqiC